MSNEYIDYLSKDYEAFRADMINRIPRKLPEWTDYSESDAGIVLLELMAYGLDILSYYQDRLVNEMFLPTAQQRQSVIDICKLVGYTLREPVPSTTTLVFEVTPSTEDIIIPAGFQVSTKEIQNEAPIVFETDTNLTIPVGNTGLETDGSGNYLYSVTATQGITIINDVLGSSTETPAQEFKTTYPNVIEGTLRVYVNEDSGFELWTDVSKELVQTTESGKHYWSEVTADGYTIIQFGSGVDGKIPLEGNSNIKASYRVGGGAYTNVGSNTITELNSSLSGIKRVFNPVPATGGLDREPIEEAKVNAPKHLRTNVRAVTKSDHELQALKVNGVLKAYAEANSLDENIVNICVVEKDGFILSEVQQDVLEHLDDVKIIGKTINIETTEFVEADLSISILTDGDTATVQSAAEEAIYNEFDKENREYGQDEPRFKLFSLLGNIDDVLSIDITKMTNIPQVKERTNSGTVTWGDVVINPTNTLRGSWKVEITDAGTNTFTVYFDEAGEFSGSEVSKGTGTLGTEFTSSGGEITFTLSGSGVSNGDNWTFKTQKYNDNLIIDDREFLTLGNLSLSVVGG